MNKSHYIEKGDEQFFCSLQVPIITKLHDTCELQPSMYNQEGIQQFEANINSKTN